MDSASSHRDEEGLSMAKVLGIDLFPGVPNTSECTQECDQFFGYLEA